MFLTFQTKSDILTTLMFFVIIHEMWGYGGILECSVSNPPIY